MTFRVDGQPPVASRPAEPVRIGRVHHRRHAWGRDQQFAATRAGLPSNGVRAHQDWGQKWMSRPGWLFHLTAWAVAL